MLYGDNNNWFAAYALWLLELYGHENVSLMDGGRVKWLADSRPTTTDVPQIAAVELHGSGRPNPALRAKRDEVLAAARERRPAARRRAQPRGVHAARSSRPRAWRRRRSAPATFPARKNIPWARAVNEDGTFKIARGVEGSSTATPASRRASRRSPTAASASAPSHTWFVLKHILGYEDVKNYDGSWTEYGSLIDVPIER